MHLPRLRALRELRGLSQLDLAQRSGVNRRTIINVEQDKPARPSTARRLAEALDVEITDLVGEAALPKGAAASISSSERLARRNEARRRATELAYTALEALRDMLRAYAAGTEPNWPVEALEAVRTETQGLALNLGALLIEAGREDLSVDVISAAHAVDQLLARRAEVLREEGDPYAGEEEAVADAHRARAALQELAAA